MLSLPAGTIHVWQSVIDNVAGQDYQRCWMALDEDERKRALRFHFEHLTRRFVACRGQLKILLGAYLSVAPKSVQLCTGEHGKPRIKGNLPDSGLVFNISHSEHQALFCFGHDLALGADLECWRTLSNMEAIVNRCFAPVEREYWSSFDKLGRTKMFFDLWVRKESFVKATGRGISLGMDRCVIGPDRGFQFLEIPESCGTVSQWHLYNITADEGFSAAIAAKHTRCQVIHRRLFSNLKTVFDCAQ